MTRAAMKAAHSAARVAGGRAETWRARARCLRARAEAVDVWGRAARTDLVQIECRRKARAIRAAAAACDRRAEGWERRAWEALCRACRPADPEECRECVGWRRGEAV